MRKVIASALAGVAIVASGSVGASTALSTIAVSATVVRSCAVAATTMPFGNYTPGTGALTNSPNINVTCTKGTPFSVALDKGAGGTIPQRLMTLSGGGGTLQYNLYTTAGTGGSIFGDGTTGNGVTVAGTGNGATAVAIPVFGTLPDNATNQTAPAGAYADTVNVTVTY